MKNRLFFCLLILLTACTKERQIGPDPKLNQFLSDKQYKKLVIEIAFEDGMQPSSLAIDNLKSFLENLLNKPDGIEIVQKSVSNETKTVYSFEELKDLEKTHRLTKAENNTASAYLFFAGGDYDQNSGNSKVLGIAYGASSIVIFEKTIRSLSGGLTQPATATVENSVMNHEFGHLLGLVDNGTPMVDAHLDEAHGKHCSNSKCLMFYTTESSDLIANLVGGKVPELDENCRNDLRGNGGK